MRVRVVREVVCDRCNASTQGRTTAAELRSRVKQEGWAVLNGLTVCPDCARAMSAPPRYKKPTLDQLHILDGLAARGFETPWELSKTHKALLHRGWIGTSRLPNYQFGYPTLAVYITLSGEQELNGKHGDPLRREKTHLRERRAAWEAAARAGVGLASVAEEVPAR